MNEWVDDDDGVRVYTYEQHMRHFGHRVNHRTVRSKAGVINGNSIHIWPGECREQLARKAAEEE